MKKNKILLALDTCGDCLKLALSADGRIYTIRKKTIKQERYIFLLLEKLLFKAKLNFGDINTVCVLKGPGRFTGIRMGLTFASVIGKFQKCKTYAINTLCALAFEGFISKEFKKSKTRLIASVIHAFGGEYYLQFFKTGKNITPVGKPLWLDRKNLIKEIDEKKLPLFILVYSKPPDVPFEDKKNLLVLEGINPQTMIKMAGQKICLENDLKPLYLKKARFET